MFIETLKSEFHITPKSILHIGANRGQEVQLYDSHGIKGVHIEADPASFDFLAERCKAFPTQKPVQALLDHTAGQEVDFNISTNFAVASSLLDLGRVPLAHPNVAYTSTIKLTTTTVDALYAEKTIPDDIDFVVMDVQGAECRVLEGAAEFFSKSKIFGIYIEVSLDELYDGGAVFSEINDLMQSRGFYLNGVKFNNKGWGNALYLQRWWPVSPEEIVPIRQVTSGA